MAFVELVARTNFSFLRGGSSPKSLVGRAAELGYDALGVADCDGLYGMVRALEAAEEAGVRLVVGCEIAIDGPAANPEPRREELGRLWLYVATIEGYKNLCHILTRSHERHPKGQPRKPDENVPRNQFAGIDLDSVCTFANGLWCLCPPDRETCTTRLKEAFGDRLSVLAWRHFDGEDATRVARAEAVAQTLCVPVCATNRVLFARREEKPVLDVLHCIREGTTLDEAGRALLPNAEAHLKSADEMTSLFVERPEWLARSREVAEACRFSLRELKYRFPSEVGVRKGRCDGIAHESADQALRRLTEEGARTRYPRGLPHSVRAQIDKELDLVRELEVAPYFLSVHDIIEMARARDILCQGRGSAANSAVCYCLGITVDRPVAKQPAV